MNQVNEQMKKIICLRLYGPFEPADLSSVHRLHLYDFYDTDLEEIFDDYLLLINNASSDEIVLCLILCWQLGTFNNNNTHHKQYLRVSYIGSGHIYNTHQMYRLYYDVSFVCLAIMRMYNSGDRDMLACRIKLIRGHIFWLTI